MVETVQLSIATEEDSDELELPIALLERLAEGDQSPAETVTDLIHLSVASRAHHLVHHGESGDGDLEAAETAVMDGFEERFGMTFGEATGHQH